MQTAMNCPTTHHLNGTRSHASRQQWSAASLWKLLAVGFIAAAVGCLSRAERPIRGAPPPREQWREIGSEDFTVRACPKYAPMWLRNDCELAYTNEGLLEIMPTSFFGYRRMHNRMYSVTLRPKAGEELFIDGGYWTIRSFTDEEISIQGEPPDEKTGGVSERCTVVGSCHRKRGPLHMAGKSLWNRYQTQTMVNSLRRYY